MQNLVKRATQTLLKRQVNKVLPVITQIHVAPIMLCNTPQYTFCAEANDYSNFDRVSSYENLISRISSSNSINEILKVFAVNEQLMKNEHIVLSLRMMARLLRNTNQTDIDSLQNDERYKNLTNKVVQSIDSLNEYEVLDFLFWMRKFKVQRINLNMSSEDLDKFFNKVSEFLKSKSFNFRNLVNLYYDYSFINKTSHDICIELLRELRSDNKLLTPFTVIQILQAASRKTTYRQTQELMLANYVTNNFQSLLDEFDTDQKCVLFKYLSVLELNFNPPRFKLPYVLYLLRNQLKDKLDQLSEASVINIVTAYQQLPREFPSDLLEDIKDMVVITIQHNSQNIKTFFLLDFIESVQKLNRRKLDDKKVAILAEELQSRILHDEFLQKPRNLERLISIYDNGLRHPALLEGITEFIKQYDKKQVQMSIYEFLARRKVELTEILQELFKSHELENIGTYNQVRLYLLLSFLPNSQQFQPQLDQLKPIVDNIAQNEAGRFINILKNSTIYGTTRKHYMDICIAKIQQQFLESETSQKHMELVNFFKNCFNSIELKEQKNQWMEWFTQNSSKLNENSVSRVIDTFFQLDSFGVDQFLLFFHIITLENQSKLSLTRLLFILKDNSTFTNQLIRYENLFKKFLQILTLACEQQPQGIRLQYIYAFAQRVNSQGYKSELYKRFLKKAYEQHKKNGQTEASNQTEFMFGMMLLEFNQLQSQHAISLYDKNEANLRDIVIKSKFYSYVLLHSSADYRDSRHDYTVQLLDQLSTNFNSTNNSKVLNSLATYLSFPSQYVSENKDILMKTLKEYINQGNEKLYIQLISALNSKYVRTSYDLYFPFIKEIINSYPNFRKKLPTGVVIDILVKFVSINCKYPTIYNYILEDIGNNFNQLTAEQRVKSLEAFGTLQIKQDDFFIKNLEKIKENPTQYRGYYKSIANSLYKIGLVSEESNAIILEIFKILGRDMNIDETFAHLRFLAMAGIEGEEELVKACFNSLPEQKTTFHNKFRNKGEIVMLSEYFARKYQNPEFVTKIQEFLPEGSESYEQIQQNFFKPTNTQTENNAKLIGEYLKVMKIDYQIFQDINGIPVDIVIPEKNILIKIVQARDCNFDRSSYNGKTHILQRIYQTLGDQYQVILLNNIEFRVARDDQSRINILEALGISSNHQGEYDFSTIEQSQYTNNKKYNKKQNQNESNVELDTEEDDLNDKL